MHKFKIFIPPDWFKLWLIILGLSLVQTTQAVTFQGCIFFDQNGNNTYEIGEPVRANAFVYFIDKGGYSTPITGEDGCYSFISNHTGDFKIWIDIPTNMRQVTPVAGEIGQPAFYDLPVTNVNQTIRVNFGLVGETPTEIWSMRDDGVMVSNSEYDMLVKPNKDAIGKTTMQIKQVGDVYQGDNQTAQVYVAPKNTVPLNQVGDVYQGDNQAYQVYVAPNNNRSASRSGGADEFSILVGKNVSDTGEEVALNAQTNSDGSVSFMDPQSPTVTVTAHSDGKYTGVDNSSPSVNVTFDQTGHIIATDNDDPTMSLLIDKTSGETTITDSEYPTTKATINPDGSYIITDEEFSNLIATVYANNEYVVQDLENNMIVHIDSQGNYMVVDNESGMCVVLPNTRGFLSNLLKGVKKVFNTVTRFVSKVASFVAKAAQFVVKVARVISVVARVVAVVAKVAAVLFPPLCPLFCAIASFAEGVATISDVVGNFASRVANIAESIQNGGGIWVGNYGGCNDVRRGVREGTIYEPVGNVGDDLSDVMANLICQVTQQTKISQESFLQTIDLPSINPEGKNTQNCACCSIFVEDRLKEFFETGKVKYKFPATGDGKCIQPTIPPLEKIFNTNHQKVNGLGDIEKILKDAGNGARGIVAVGVECDDQTKNKGHVFNAVNYQGSVLFLDGQKGRRIFPNEYNATPLEGCLLKFAFIRTDSVMARSSSNRRPSVEIKTTASPQYCLSPPFTVLDYLTASHTSQSNRLTWATLAEFGNKGFNVYRAEKNAAGELINQTKVNANLVPAQEGAQWGATYNFEDTGTIPGKTYFYMIEDVDSDGVNTLQEEFIAEVKSNELLPAACLLYGVQDQALNDSIFFSFSPRESTVQKLGETCKGCDIEALAIHPVTGEIYLGSGDNAFGHPKGHLYQLDAQSGELRSVGNTGFKDISGLAFDQRGTLWAWAKGQGLATLNLDTGEGELVLPTPVELADLTWDETSQVLYGVIGQELWRYMPADGSVAKVCGGLPPKTEAVKVLPSSVLPEGLVLLGSHNNQKLELQAFEIAACQLRQAFNFTIGYDDVEGFAMPMAACR